MPVSSENISKLKEMFEDELTQQLLENVSLKTVSEGKILVEIRDHIQFVPLLVEGRIKVERRDGKGNGFLLHYVKPMEICPISFFYGFNHQKSDLRCITDTPITYFSIPMELAKSWFEKFPTWRNYLARLTQQQQAKLLNSFDDIVFNDLSIRISRYLQESLSFIDTQTLFVKHQEIAFDLKVSRESVSRTLKKMEKEGKLILGRNRIILLNID